MSVANKGVDYYAFLSSKSFTVDFSKPTDDGDNMETIHETDTDKMLSGNFQIGTGDIGLFDVYGRFQWWAKMNGTQLSTQYCSINPITGNLDDDKDTTMGNLLNTPAVINSNNMISYGFYDSGCGFGGITNQDQSYVYVTDNYSIWMGDLIKTNADFGSKPFHEFALPAAHDSGMWATTRLVQILDDPMLTSLFIPLVQAAFGIVTQTKYVKRTMINFSFTQKETTTTLLNLGIRFLDFRPGYCYEGLNDGNLYHQHSFIPGYSYASFLNDILYFLIKNPSEIVVVNNNYQQFFSTSMQPTNDTLNKYFTDAQEYTGTTKTIVAGNKSDLGTTYNDLISAKKRIIFLNQVNAIDDATKYDSYSNDAYHTTDVNTILSALNGMTSAGQENVDYTILQLQGTSQATGGGAISSLCAFSDASSPLMSTKANFDHQTYEWLKQNVMNKFNNSGLIVFLNDFADNGCQND